MAVQSDKIIIDKKCINPDAASGLIVFLENLIGLAKGIKLIGVKKLAIDAFDTKKIDEYAAQAKAS